MGGREGEELPADDGEADHIGERRMNPPGGCETQPKILKYWDPTRIAVAQTCWRKHWYSNILGLRQNDGYNVHFEWGAAAHECYQCFDDCIAGGVERKIAAQLTLRLASELSWSTTLDQPKWGSFLVACRCSDPEFVPSVKDPRKEVLNRKRCKYAKKWFDLDSFPGGRCQCGRALVKEKTWFDDHPKKNRANLLAAVETYCEDPGLPPYDFPDKTVPVTEVQHIIPLPVESPGGDYYQLVVNIDSIVDHQGWAAIRERKTTGLPLWDKNGGPNFKFWKTYRMGPQVDSYDIVGSIVYADGERVPKLLIEATGLSAGGKVEIAREVIPISEERRAEWFNEMLDIIMEAEKRTLNVTENGWDPERAFPRRTTACHGQFGTCPYWYHLCTQGSSKREEAIAQHFHAEHWDPLRATSEVEGAEE